MIRLWDWRNGKEVAAADTGHVGTPEAVEFSEDGERLYSRSHDSIRIWDNELHSVGETITGFWITDWAFAEDEGNVAAVDIVDGDHVIQEYDAESGQKIREPLKGHHQEHRRH